MGQGASMEVFVTGKRPVAAGVMLLELRATGGEDLPAWAPGAHIDLCMPHGLTRQYSLCGDVQQLQSYQVAVLHAPEGRGGSAYVHGSLALHQKITISPPRNLFPFKPSSHHLFIAGGIGITPLLPMLVQATQEGSDWTLWYGGRSRSSMAFVDELKALHGERVHIWPQDELAHLPLAQLARESRQEAMVYCCGPEPLLEAVSAGFTDRSAGFLHMERFAPKNDARAHDDVAFSIHLAQSDLTLAVPHDKTIMDVLLQAGIPVLHSCREGMCGSCEVAVLAGRIDHRDSILSQEEQDAHNTMMVCVSRSHSPTLVLDL